MKKVSYISAGPRGMPGSKISSNSGTFWAAANYTESLVMLSFLLLPLLPPSQFPCGAAGPQVWAGTLSLPLAIWRQSVASRQWVIFHLPALITENMTWTGASRPEVSCPSQARWVILSSRQEICFPLPQLLLVPTSTCTLTAAPKPFSSLQTVTWLFCPFSSGFGEL